MKTISRNKLKTTVLRTQIPKYNNGERDNFLQNTVNKYTLKQQKKN